MDKEKGSQARAKKRQFGFKTEFSRKHFQRFCLLFCVITKSTRRVRGIRDTDSSPHSTYPYTHSKVWLSFLAEKSFFFAADVDCYRDPQLVQMQRTGDCGEPGCNTYNYNMTLHLGGSENTMGEGLKDYKSQRTGTSAGAQHHPYMAEKLYP